VVWRSQGRWEVTLKRDGKYAYKVVRQMIAIDIFSFDYAANHAGRNKPCTSSPPGSLDMESYNQLIPERKPSVSVDLVANKGEGYTLDSLKKTFNAIVATRHATQASMDKVNNAESIADLEPVASPV
jgi:hypothetical protein